MSQRGILKTKGNWFTGATLFCRIRFIMSLASAVSGSLQALTQQIEASRPGRSSSPALQTAASLSARFSAELS